MFWRLHELLIQVWNFVTFREQTFLYTKLFVWMRIKNLKKKSGIWNQILLSIEGTSLTCITLIGNPVSFANCSRMCLVGFGVCEKADFKISSCFALIVVLGPRRLDPPFPSSGDLFSACESRVSGSPSREPWEVNRYNWMRQCGRVARSMKRDGRI